MSEAQSADLGVRVPISSSRESVLLFPDEIRGAAEDVMSLLAAELAPLSTWIELAVYFYRMKEFEAFEQFLNEPLGSRAREHLSPHDHRYRESSLRAYQILAAYAIEKYHAVDAAGADEAKNHERQQVLKFIKQADNIDNMSPYTLLLKALFEIVSNDKLDEALRYLRNLNERIKGSDERRRIGREFTFPVFLLRGVLAMQQRQYSDAVTFFADAIRANPDSGSMLRVALGLACCADQQYERAKAAFERALELEPFNTQAHIGYALASLALASKRTTTEKERRKLHKEAYERIVVASRTDPQNPMVLNHVANHQFESWQRLGEALVMEPNRLSLHMSKKDALVWDLKSGYRVRFLGDNGYVEARILNECDTTAVLNDDESKTYTLEIDAEITDVNSVVLEARPFKSVELLVVQAYSRSTSPEIKGESMYIFGRMLHARHEYKQAEDVYKHAIQQYPEFSLAHFALGQVYLARNKLAEAIQCFEHVESKMPDDADTRAYLALLRGLQHDKTTPVEKLEEMALTFPFALDLWLSQARIRQNKTSDFEGALQCYRHAMEIYLNRNEPVPAEILNNLSVLSSQAGRLAEALKYATMCLETVEGSQTEEDGVVPYFHYAANKVFYRWSDPVANVMKHDEELDAYELQPDCDPELFHVGEDILVGDQLVCTIEAIANGVIVVNADISRAIENGTYTVKRKELRGNFGSGTLTYAFTYGRLQEMVGDTLAASEVYLQILKLHPAHIQCYLRLYAIARDCGRFDEAEFWLGRAAEVDGADVDVVVAMGDLLLRKGEKSECQHLLDKLMTKGVKDERVMMSLGNCWYESREQGRDRLDGASKYYRTVLSSFPDNVYAATGVGIACAEYDALEAAKDIFTRVRESTGNSVPGLYENAAHIALVQDRCSDAMFLYKSMLQHCDPRHSAQAYEYLSLAHFVQRQYQDSARAMMNSLHMNPNELASWYNLAYILESGSYWVLQKETRTLKEVQQAVDDIALAANIFKSINNVLGTLTDTGRTDKMKVVDHLKYCEGDLLTAAQKYLEHEMEKERKERESRRAQEELHAQYLEERKRKREEELRAQAELQSEQQRRAQEQDNRLKELMSTQWKQSQLVAKKREGKEPKEPKEGGRRRRKAEKAQPAPGSTMPIDSDEDIFGSDSSEDEAPQPPPVIDSDDEEQLELDAKRKIDAIYQEGQQKEVAQQAAARRRIEDDDDDESGDGDRF